MAHAPYGYPPFDAPKPVAPGLWVVDAEPMRVLGAAVPVRMTVARLSDGGLWLHSPTRFSPALLGALEALGPVRHLVSPNVAHWTYLKDWQRACPETTTWAAPNLRRRLQVRLSRVRLDRDLGDEPLPEWAADLDQAVILGGAGFREVAFLHRASRTAILTDLVLNLEDERVPAATRAYARATGTRAPLGSTPRYLRPVIQLRRREAAAAVERVLAWAPRAGPLRPRPPVRGGRRRAAAAGDGVAARVTPRAGPAPWRLPGSHDCDGEAPTAPSAAAPEAGGASRPACAGGVGVAHDRGRAGGAAGVSQASVLHESANGDRWLLVREGAEGRVVVRHEPNASSGGRASELEVGALIAQGGHGGSVPRGGVGG